MGMAVITDWEQEELIYNAYHEVGHAVARLKGRYPTLAREINIIPEGSIVGFVRTRRNIDFVGTDDYEQYEVVSLVAGRTAERKLTGITSGSDSCARDDLKKARAILRKMVPDDRERRSLMKVLVAESEAILEDNWPLVEAVVGALIDEKRLLDIQFLEIIRQVDPKTGFNFLTIAELMAKKEEYLRRRKS